MVEANAEEKSTLREDLGKAFDEAFEAPDDASSENDENAESGEKDKETVEKIDLEEDENPASDEEFSTDDRKDAEKDDDDDLFDDEPDKAAKSEEKESDEGEKEAESADPLEPLAHWHKEDREMFEGLPPEAKKFLIDRDKGFQRTATEKQMEVSDIKRALEPVREALAESGVSEADAVRRLVGAHMRLVKKPKETIIELMSSYGLDISDIIGDNESEATSSSAADKKIAELEKRLAAAEERTQDSAKAAVQQTIKEFADTHEFYGEVEDDMANLAMGYRARGVEPPSLGELYKKACRMNESVMKKLRAKRVAASKETDKSRLRRSKNAAKATVKGSNKTSNAEQKPATTLRDDLSATFDKVMEGSN